MTKTIYNQLSEKLYNAYAMAKYEGKDGEKELVADLLIEPQVVAIFDALYRNEADTEDGLYTPDIFDSIKALFPVEPNALDFTPNSMAASFLTERARRFAIQKHRDINQTYGDDRNEVPYEYHLMSVRNYYKKYKHHVPVEDQPLVESGAWCHDVVEDANQTFNDVKNAVSEGVAHIACALSTNKHGVNRKARADQDYYNRIKAVKYAPFIKLCDRLANVSNGGKMVDGYRKEMPAFLGALMPEIDGYQDMINELNELVNPNRKFVNA